MAEIFQMIIEDAKFAYWQLYAISRFPPFYIGYSRFMAEIAAHNWRKQVNYKLQKT